MAQNLDTRVVLPPANQAAILARLASQKPAPTTIERVWQDFGSKTKTPTPTVAGIMPVAERRAENLEGHQNISDEHESRDSNRVLARATKYVVKRTSQTGPKPETNQ